MKPSSRLLAAFAVAVSALPAAVSAHFKLLEPTSWLIENERGGCSANSVVSAFDVVTQVSSRLRVSGIQIHMMAATRNAAPATEKATPKPRVLASDATTNGAAALAMRPVL